MKTFIHSTDIPVIAKIFNPTTDLVFVVVPTNTQYSLANIKAHLGCQIRFFVNQELLAFALTARPNQSITVINLHPDGIASTLVTQYPEIVLIDLHGKKQADPQLGTKQFDFINNADGTIRWMYDHQYDKPIFLNLYNNLNWKGDLFKTTLKTGFKLGVKNWLKSGAIWITSTKELFLEGINNKGQYAIFTGTIGEQRNAVISFVQGQKATKFLKMPLTASAKVLVRNEWNYLQQLQSYKLRKITLPKTKKVGDNIMVSNVRPEQKINNRDLKGLHLAALNELYEHTIAPAILNQSNAWLSLQKDLSFLEDAKINNNLPKEKVTRIYHLLKQLATQLNTNNFVPTAIANRDLTPSNSYLTDKAVHIYDWELAERLPLLYDAFHYVFQSSVLVKKLPFIAIERQVIALEKVPIVEKMIKEFEIDYNQAYQFYLLRNTAYYLRKYVGQTDLPMQAHWLIDAWLEALENLTYTTPQKSLMYVNELGGW